MIKKKLFTIGLLSLMSLSIVACGKETVVTNENDTTTETVVSDNTSSTDEVITEETQTEETAEVEDGSTEVVSENTTESSESQSTTEDTNVEVPAVTEGTDKFGAIGGIGIDPVNGSNYKATFGTAGFTFSDEIGREEQHVLKLVYADDEDVNAKVYGLDRNKDYSSFDIEGEGYYGYLIDVSKADKKPAMSFNGLTWGATGDEIVAKYGKPKDIEAASDAIIETYVYEIDGCFVYFGVYDETASFDKGLQSINVMNMSVDYDIHYTEPSDDAGSSVPNDDDYTGLP